MAHTPITVAIERTVDPDRIAEATIWVQTGINLANKYPGFLGSGWVRTGPESETWHMLYRFEDEQTLRDWEESAERGRWLSSGEEFVHHRRSEKRTGIEGWFDVPHTPVIASDGTMTGSTPIVTPPPPRWKQAVSIWLGFFPLNLLFTLLVGALVPGWDAVPVPLKVLITTLVLTPLMAYLVLPRVTAALRPWLERGRRG
ncbi:antibiotic biosynthesis monooxygenase [Mycetocola reblochoni]|uniref:Antibiotic biosynthesis monooxygenase n=2 Tax=Mycetocola reblochoni TaxID=331618 RepID=A0A3L6ZM36_9MICO|nr:antibiotic biosynthesis monooxygenase [Mycetocola reblochoni]RLP68969.1 antibiotic biosynthesis monooxygenase [Mycetocola reblochoni]SJN18732.1 putative membrane protein [Mycetocola reblochoni REB411]